MANKQQYRTQLSWTKNSLQTEQANLSQHAEQYRGLAALIKDKFNRQALSPEEAQAKAAYLAANPNDDRAEQAALRTKLGTLQQEYDRALRSVADLSDQRAAGLKHLLIEDQPSALKKYGVPLAVAGAGVTVGMFHKEIGDAFTTHNMESNLSTMGEGIKSGANAIGEGGKAVGEWASSSPEAMALMCIISLIVAVGVACVAAKAVNWARTPEPAYDPSAHRINAQSGEIEAAAQHQQLPTLR